MGVEHHFITSQIHISRGNGCSQRVVRREITSRREETQNILPSGNKCNHAGHFEWSPYATDPIVWDLWGNACELLNVKGRPPKEQATPSIWVRRQGRWCAREKKSCITDTVNLLASLALRDGLTWWDVAPWWNFRDVLAPPLCYHCARRKVSLGGEVTQGHTPKHAWGVRRKRVNQLPSRASALETLWSRHRWEIETYLWASIEAD